MVIKIELTKGRQALVDEIDSDLGNLSWYTLNKGSLSYARRNDYSRGKGKTILMHRIILSRLVGRPLDSLEKCDHINRNGLDNRRENLRLATRAQNAANQKKRVGPNSFKGVAWRMNHKNPKRGRWEASIRDEGKKIHLGYFASELEAARAYDRATLEHFGEFARTNFDKEDYK